MSSINMDRKKTQENLRNIINQWNANRLDLFEISEPNEELEFHGVMRFYFQDSGQKVATKCIRVSSTASTHNVIQILIEKFRPDIRMLSVPEYALYEIHENGDERKLSEDENPLLVQLNWHRDDREGRFLLRRMDDKTCQLPGFDSDGINLKRKLSKREKKEKKKREKKERKTIEKSGKSKDSLAGKLYTELPETSFTRSISNPEAVMRRRRQQKLEKKLQQFSQEGGSEAGGTLRIFGESINKDVPYKTILLSTRDTAAFAVKEILDKYGLDKEDPSQYCLAQLIVPVVVNGSVSGSEISQHQMNDLHNTQGIQEYILDEDDCPLRIEKMHSKVHGVLTFHIRRRPADYQPRKRKKKTMGTLMTNNNKQMQMQSAVKDELDNASISQQQQQQAHSPSSGYWTNNNNHDSHDINDTNSVSNSGKFNPHVPHIHHNHKQTSTPPPLPDSSNADMHLRFPVGSSIQSSDTISEPATPTMITAPLSLNSMDMMMPAMQAPQIQGHPQMVTRDAGGRASAVLATIEPDVQVVIFQKSNNGMGLSIVAAKGINQDNLGIYIKSVVKGGAADLDGRLQAGDHLLKVDGHSLIGVSQDRAAELMTKTGPIVILEIAKQGAIHHGLAGLLQQPSPSIPRGYTRRMSDIDIPSKVNQEPEMISRLRNGPNGAPMMPPQMHLQAPLTPRMQASKSVPTLNNPDQPDNGVANGIMMQPQQRRTNEYPNGIGVERVAAPYQPQGYNNGLVGSNGAPLNGPNIPKSYSDYNNAAHAKQPVNYNMPSSQSSQQIVHHSCNNTNNVNNYSPPRPESQLSMQSQQQSSFQEERHYQNIQMFQVQPQPPPLSKQAINQTNTIPAQQRMQQQHVHSSHSSLQHPLDAAQSAPQFSQQQPGRPLSALISTREQEQYINHNTNSNPTPNSPRQPPPPSPHLSNSNFQFPEQYQSQAHPQFNNINSHPAFQRQYSDIRNDTQAMMEYPAPQIRNYPPHPHGYMPDPRDPRQQQRDYMRQEAKMDEMREEIMRREERSQYPAPHGHGNAMMMRPQWPQRPPAPPQAYHLMNGSGPPKPRQNQLGPQFSQGPNGPFMRQTSMRDQQEGVNAAPVNAAYRPPPAVSYRYGPSGYPPSKQDPLQQQGQSPNSLPQRATPLSYNMLNSTRPNDMKRSEQSGVVSPSPWEREEKERVYQKKLDESMKSRDDEIRYLESLPVRSPAQVARLRTLVFDREFQKVAEKARGEDEEEDDDQDVLERADQRERTLLMNQELERTRQRRMEREQMMLQNHQPRPNVEEWAKMSQHQQVNNQLDEQSERLKQLRLEEIKRHKELRAAQLEEEKIIREARRRQVKDVRVQRGLHNRGQPYLNNPDLNTPDIPPPLPKSPPPVELQAPVRHDRLLSTSSNDQPIHENKKKSISFQEPQIMSKRNGDGNGIGINGISDGQQNHVPKKVSWNDAPTNEQQHQGGKQTKEPTDGNDVDDCFTLQDIDEVLGTSTNDSNSWLNNSYISGNTPGVIGAQEVYNDPRQRIEAQKMKSLQSQRPAVVGPEKLSFKEKMKMFAIDAGLQETPKDKVKISKAQREIETNHDGSPKQASNNNIGDENPIEQMNVT